MKKILFVAAVALLASAPAMAQDASGSPVFGEATLSAGFDDGAPLQRRFRGGGPNDASHLPGACTGNVGTPPDFRVTYTAGGLPLIFRSVSNADTALVINGPDGRWYCDDDGFGDLDAQYRFDRPQSGVYDIWIAVVNGREADATLVVSER